ncbi:UNVERIFIED_CONTAM: hypothetical protein FKN15_007645 [Acipenser sinensis]
MGVASFLHCPVNPFVSPVSDSGSSVPVLAVSAVALALSCAVLLAVFLKRLSRFPHTHNETVSVFNFAFPSFHAPWRSSRPSVHRCPRCTWEGGVKQEEASEIETQTSPDPLCTATTSDLEAGLENLEVRGVSGSWREEKSAMTDATAADRGLHTSTDSSAAPQASTPRNVAGSNP